MTTLYDKAYETFCLDVNPESLFRNVRVLVERNLNSVGFAQITNRQHCLPISDERWATGPNFTIGNNFYYLNGFVVCKAEDFLVITINAQRVNGFKYVREMSFDKTGKIVSELAVPGPKLSLDTPEIDILPFYFMGLLSAVKYMSDDVADVS